MKQIGQWQVAEDTDIPSADLIGPPRWLCPIDGTRVYSGRDASAHDEHFHPETSDETGRSAVEDEHLRREALEWAVRTCNHAASAQDVTKQADAFLAYLRGTA